MSLNSRAVLTARNTESSLHTYQVAQMKHDRTYHREIWCLGVHGGMNHVVLHLTKYLYPLFSKDTSSKDSRKALIDSFIMTISAGNLLNLDFSQHLDAIEKQRKEQTEQNFINEYIYLLSKLAKACEATDHQEDYPVRQVWHKNLESFLALLLAEADKRNLEIFEASSQRLQEVEQSHSLKNIFREMIL